MSWTAANPQIVGAGQTGETLTVTASTVCPKHGWLYPCYRCELDRRIADARLDRIWALGRVGSHRPFRKPITIRTERTHAREK